jgi:hypothetical protein
VTEHEKRYARFSRFYDGRNRFDVTDIVFKRLDIKALAIRISATTEIDGVYG